LLLSLLMLSHLLRESNQLTSSQTLTSRTVANSSVAESLAWDFKPNMQRRRSGSITLHKSTLAYYVKT
jgi:hypothetical protein